MFKIILGIGGFIAGLPLGFVGMFVIADWFRVNWIHGDSLPIRVIVLVCILTSLLGVGIGHLCDRRSSRHPLD
ncbi:hypothetical protein [Gimesia sp.]|uniref:hypothetical protein n=1 Tax=Gimesia sp. TaxID=2024833 RepID=UPI003A8F8CB9